jgi:hypothetical protein
MQLLGWLTVATAVAAQPADPQTLYSLATEGSSKQLQAGRAGTWVLEIRPTAGAHVSDEAPLKVELKGTNVRPAKTSLQRSDLVKASPPRFEVPVAAEGVGKGTVDAKVTFFICTETLCARQQKTVQVAMDVLAAAPAGSP